MTTIWHSFLLLLARAADRELAKMVQFLKVENQILRSKLPRRIAVTLPERRRLVKFGRALGSAIHTLLTIVSPRTFLRWVNGETAAARKRKSGRRRTEADIRELILKIARETGFGYTRIIGELRKLGVRRVSRSTVINILKAGGFDPGPKRGEGTWSDFLTRHAASLWACDFFSKKVVTARGLVDYFVLFFIHVGSRRVYVAGVSANPDARWMAQTARNVSMFLAEQPVKPRFLIRDLDGKFVPQFDAILESDGIAVCPSGRARPT
jgi:putative transposase